MQKPLQHFNYTTPANHYRTTEFQSTETRAPFHKTRPLFSSQILHPQTLELLFTQILHTVSGNVQYVVHGLSHAGSSLLWGVPGHHILLIRLKHLHVCDIVMEVHAAGNIVLCDKPCCHDGNFACPQYVVMHNRMNNGKLYTLYCIFKNSSKM